MYVDAKKIRSCLRGCLRFQASVVSQSFNLLSSRSFVVAVSVYFRFFATSFVLFYLRADFYATTLQYITKLRGVRQDL